MAKTRLNNVYHGMKARCYNKNAPKYKNYGARGITICEEWKNDFKTFADWAVKNGYDEKAKRGTCTIDRIDVNGNYEPSNCRWVSTKVNCNNKRNNHLITFENKTHTLSEWAKLLGIKNSTLSMRLKHYKWAIGKALNSESKR